MTDPFALEGRFILVTGASSKLMVKRTDFTFLSRDGFESEVTVKTFGVGAQGPAPPRGEHRGPERQRLVGARRPRLEVGHLYSHGGVDGVGRLQQAGEQDRVEPGAMLRGPPPERDTCRALTCAWRGARRTRKGAPSLAPTSTSRSRTSWTRRASTPARPTWRAGRPRSKPHRPRRGPRLQCLPHARDVLPV